MQTGTVEVEALEEEAVEKAHAVTVPAGAGLGDHTAAAQTRKQKSDPVERCASLDESGRLVCLRSSRWLPRQNSTANKSHQAG